MKREVLINIDTDITSDGEKGTISELYKGELMDSEKDMASYIFYKETSEDGSITDCRMIIKGRSLTLRKAGASVTVMEFEKGHECEISYSTMYGSMDFVLLTDNISVLTDGDIRLIHIEYELKNNDTVISQHDMRIKIRPV